MVLLPKTPPLPRDVDFALCRRIERVIQPILKTYFRYRVEGFDRLPKGRLLLVSVHSGGIWPVDSLILGAEFLRHTEFQRPIHYLAHDILWRLPPAFVDVIERIGVVQANPNGAAMLLEADRALAVYPGGTREVYRPFAERNKINWNGHMGYVRLAVRTRTPIVPVPSIGAHETLIVLTSGERMNRLVGLSRILRKVPVLPIALTFPWGVALPVPPHIPLPAQITLRAMEPLELHNLPDGRALFRRNPRGDPELMRRLHHLVQEKMQEGMDDLARDRVPFLGKRRSPASSAA